MVGELQQPGGIYRKAHQRGRDEVREQVKRLLFDGVTDQHAVVITVQIIGDG